MASNNRCTVCGKAGIPGLYRGSGKCQYHWNVGAFGREWADRVEAAEKAAPGFASVEEAGRALVEGLAAVAKPSSSVPDWAKELTEEVLGGPPFKIGDRVQHPDGYLVEIIDGQYWGMHGLSNFWHWRRVQADGQLSAENEYGYGWQT